MSLCFRTLCSSSRGNCLAIWTENSCVLIDCGFRSQISCERTLTEHFGHKPQVDGVVVTHNHSDHINYSSLRVLELHGLQVRTHEKNVDQLQRKHFRGRIFEDLKLMPFSDKSFEMGEISFEPIHLSHHPEYFTCGFLIRYHQKDIWHKIIIASDLRDGHAILEYLIDADFIYIESNHDPELLALYPNYNSHFHMSNLKTSEVLCIARTKSRHAPKAVMLGHLSFIRNDADLVLRSLETTFQQSGQNLDYKIYVAPRYEESSPIKIVE